MAASVPTLPAMFSPNRARSLWLLIVSSLFVVGGFFTPREESFSRLYLIGFFGLCMLAGIVKLLPRSSYLALTGEGLTIVSLYRKYFVPWSDVQSFVPIQVQSSKFVGWINAPGCGDHSAIRRIGRVVSGVDGLLPDTYGMNADDFASMLNELLKKHATLAL